MNIAVADNNSRKFTNDLIKHWESKGHNIQIQGPDHRVKYEQGASEYLAQWADLYYIDTWDNNIHYLYKLYHGLQERAQDLKWDNNKKPKIIVRALDWEIWLGLARSQEMVDWVDQVICIAPHIEKMMKADRDNATGNILDWKDKIKCIRPGVNLEKFTLKQKQTDGFQLGMALGDMWWPKNHMAGLDIFTTLYRNDPRWRLHIRGQHEGGNEFWKKMYEYYIESRGLQDVVTLYSPVEDMNQWYEGIDILLHPGMKEAFCYAVGEAMAKGIPAVINDFLGSHDIWPSESIYQTHQEAVTMITNISKDPVKNREYIEQNYSLKRQMEETDEYLGT